MKPSEKSSPYAEMVDKSLQQISESGIFVDFKAEGMVKVYESEETLVIDENSVGCLVSFSVLSFHYVCLRFSLFIRSCCLEVLMREV